MCKVIVTVVITVITIYLFIFRYSYPSQGGLSAGAVRQQNIMKTKQNKTKINSGLQECVEVMKYDCETD